METYRQFCPIARGAEVFAMRWTPLIIRNMTLGCRTFGEIRSGLPGIPKALLSQRIKMLERYGVLERRPNPRGRGSLYELTTAGHELRAVTAALGAWGSRWLELAPPHFDSGVLLWGLSKTLTATDIPEKRTLVRFNLRDGEHRRFWLLLERPNAEVCTKPPGFEDDVVVDTTQEWLARWYVGEIQLGIAMRRQLMWVDGPRPLVRMLSNWGGRGRIDPHSIDEEGSPAEEAGSAGGSAFRADDMMIQQF